MDPLTQKRHTPRRDDEVAAWLKHQRDTYQGGSLEAWRVLGRLLEEYREKADYGLRLDQDGGDP